MLACSVTFLLAAAAVVALAETRAAIELPKPQTAGGKPLIEALRERRSSREFSPRQLSPQVLANLLWAAYGVNRPDGRRTAPSAMNYQAVDVFVILPDGAYLYNANANRLDPLLSGDLRSSTGTQDFVGRAALELLYVADYAHLGNSQEADKTLFAATEAGSISQNVYLFCASEGLATVIRASVNRESLSKALRLRPDQKILLAQTVGYPK